MDLCEEHWVVLMNEFNRHMHADQLVDDDTLPCSHSLTSLVCCMSLKGWFPRPIGCLLACMAGYVASNSAVVSDSVVADEHQALGNGQY